MSTRASDEQLMQRAIELAATARTRTSPNPWVGCVDPEPGRRALRGRDRAARAGPTPRSLPCGPPARRLAARRLPRPSSRARTTAAPRPAWTRSSLRAWRVWSSASKTPTRMCAGEGIARLRAAGIEVTIGACADEVRAQLAPYLKHRLTGRPYVVLKLAGTLDGRTAAPDGTSQWITGDAARRDAHRLRAESDAVIVGRGHRARRRPVAHRATRPTVATRCGWCSGTRRGRQGAARGRDAGRARRRARRARSARHRAGDGRGRRDRRGHVPPRRPRRSLRRSISRRRCSAATTAAPCSPVLARRPSTTCGAAA